MPVDYQPLWLSLELALITTVLLLLICIPLASFLAFRSFRFKAVIEALVSLPLVLPPSVLGFYLLIAFSPHNAFGAFLQSFLNLRLVFSFPGLVAGSVFYSLPCIAHPLQAGLHSVPSSLLQASYTTGKSRRETMLRVVLPHFRPSILTGIVLSFAHTLREFGVLLMIGGNIEGSTRVA